MTLQSVLSLSAGMLLEKSSLSFNTLSIISVLKFLKNCVNNNLKAYCENVASYYTILVKQPELAFGE